MEEEGLTPPLLRNRNVNWERLQESLNSDNGLPTAISAPSWTGEYSVEEEDEDDDDDDALSFVIQHNDEALDWIQRWIRRPGNIIPFDASGVVLPNRTVQMEHTAQSIRDAELRYRSPRELLVNRDILGLRTFIADPVFSDFKWEYLQEIKDCFIHRQHLELDIPVIEMHPVGQTHHTTVHVEVRTTPGDDCTQILLDDNPIIYWTGDQRIHPYLTEGRNVTVEYDYRRMEKYYLDLILKICRHLNLTLYLYRDGITLSRWPEADIQYNRSTEGYDGGRYHAYFMSDRVVNDWIFKEIRNERRRRAPQKG